jgi:hypothetical protein
MYSYKFQSVCRSFSLTSHLAQQLIMSKSAIVPLLVLCVATLASGSNDGVSTFYEGIMGPISACGVPTSKLQDLPFVALNENSAFSHGSNCGRWVKITLGDNCKGGSNSPSSICNGGCAFPTYSYSILLSLPFRLRNVHSASSCFGRQSVRYMCVVLF